MNLMTIDNPYWEKFFARLVMAVNFRPRTGSNADAIDAKDIIWDCDGTLAKATEILNEIGNFDIPATLEFFKNNGGHCDCEVVFNLPGRGHRDNWEDLDHETETPV